MNRRLVIWSSIAKRGLIILVGSLGVLALGVALFPIIGEVLFGKEEWVRALPLVNPIAVSSVHDGTITLSDGRTFRPAGVRRRENISASDFDRALSAITAQGILVVRDVGDGRAFLTAEPKFYNWCGTRGRAGNPWAHWAGSYYQSPLSEVLVDCGYADIELDQPGLTPLEQWRLEGVDKLGTRREEPIRVSFDGASLRYDGMVRNAEYWMIYDELLERNWKPPPP